MLFLLISKSCPPHDVWKFYPAYSDIPSELNSETLAWPGELCQAKAQIKFVLRSLANIQNFIFMLNVTSRQIHTDKKPDRKNRLTMNDNIPSDY